MNYFGTDLQSAGHYFWEIDESGMRKSKIWFDDIPFDPEKLPEYKKGEEQNKGDVKFYHSNGYNICAINGSCIDNRWGCHSVFFTTDELTNNQLKDKILSIPISKKMIEQMPFEVRW